MIKAIRALKSEGELFKKIMGDDWKKLHPDIQKRFEKNPVPGSPLKYEGCLEELSCSFWGKVMARITRPLVGGALIPYTAYNFPVNIQVYFRALKQAICIGSEGELPFQAPQGRRTTSVDLIGKADVFASVELENDKRRIYIPVLEKHFSPRKSVVTEHKRGEAV